ncbi:NAD(P)/FAD-dependent oxidoreductase [Novosphingobium sp.]|uniref:NAD(P)/FAD-dependent oxidoreductase n=1 Tax=Novosphingobium sp. TaxID=1874826 RepID=UPI002FE08D11
MSKRQIVIVGGGVAGLDLANQLAGTPAKQLEFDVRLVDREPAHIWKPMLHTIAAGTADASAVEASFIAQARKRGFRFDPGEVIAIDRTRRKIRLSPLKIDGVEVVPERDIAYDTLILAAGSRANDFGTPGVAQYCLTIDCRKEAMAFNNRLRIDLVRAVALGRPIAIAIVGGGATGVELAAELIRIAEVVEQHGAAGARDNLQVTLIESQSRILGPFPEKVARAALCVLEDLGIKVLTNRRVASADSHGFSFNGGERIDADILLWAAGVRAPRFIADIDGVDHSKLGQIVVNARLASSDPAIYALGDCASVVAKQNDAPLPTTAQVAFQQSVYLGRYLPAMLQGCDVPEFRYRDFGSLVSLGGYAAYGTMGRFGFFKGGFLRGRVAQLGHAFLYRRHQARIYGPVRGSLLWLAEILASPARPKERLS